MATKQIEWHAVVFPGVQDYTDLCLGPKGLVYGFADRSLFFVFDPAKRKVVHQQATEAEFGPTVSSRDRGSSSAARRARSTSCS